MEGHASNLGENRLVNNTAPLFEKKAKKRKQEKNKKEEKEKKKERTTVGLTSPLFLQNECHVKLWPFLNCALQTH